MRTALKLVGGAVWTGRGLLVFIATAVVLVVIAAVLFLPGFLVDRALDHRRLDAQDKEALTAAELLEARNDALTTVLQGLAGLGILLGAGLTARTIHINREGQITERFTRAIDQLGSKELDVRLGGIYALERIARDSKNDHGPVMEVLTAFVREHSRLLENAGHADSTTDDAQSTLADELRTDLQAAITVIGRRKARHDVTGRHLNLSNAALRKAYLQGANLAKANLANANLQGANLINASLQRAALDGANLQEGRLEKANLQNARAQGAKFRGAGLEYANLQGADLANAKLQGTRANNQTTWPEGFDPTSAGVEFVD